VPKTLSKSDIVEAVAKAADIPKAKADAAINALVDAVVDNVKAGNTVRVPQLGTFKRANRKARTARNPQTGATVKVPATKVPRFTPAAGFKDNVAGKAPAKKSAAKKGAAKKTAAKKGGAKKTAAKKSAAKKTTRRR